MNSLQVLSKILHKDVLVAQKYLQTSTLYSIRKESLSRYLRLKLHKSKISESSTKQSRPRKWPKRLAVLGSVAVGTAGGVSMYNQQSIGPIYKFESDEDLGLPLDYNVEAMEKYFNARPLEVLQRTGEILSELVPYFSRLFIWEYMIRQKIRDHEGML